MKIDQRIYVFTYSGDAVVYRLKTQSLIALSLTEAEFIAAVTTAKTAKYIRSVLTKTQIQPK